MTRVGFWTASITFAAVYVLPVPVAPRSTWFRSPSRTPPTSASMATGWSPVGSYGAWTRRSGMARRFLRRLDGASSIVDRSSIGTDPRMAKRPIGEAVLAPYARQADVPAPRSFRSHAPAGSNGGTPAPAARPPGGRPRPGDGRVRARPAPGPPHRGCDHPVRPPLRGPGDDHERRAGGSAGGDRLRLRQQPQPVLERRPALRPDAGGDPRLDGLPGARLAAL